MRWIWEELGIAESDDVAVIRRAYSARLKAIDPEADPQAFIALRQARDSALAYAAGGYAVEVPLTEWLEMMVREGKVEPAPPFEPPGIAQPPAGDSEPAFSRTPADPVDPPYRGSLPDEKPDPTFSREPAGPETERVEVPDRHELPGADLERIQALLFDGAEPAAPDELEMLTRHILADPALERIETARWLEDWMAETIVRAMPRSDPMIAPAAAHFRWRERENELKRPPNIDYILERSVDPAFLIEFKADARYDLSIGGQQHFSAHDDRGGIITSVRQKEADPAARDVGFALSAGIFVVPYVFAWFLLREGHGKLARVVGLGWLAFCFLFFMLPGLLYPPPARVPQTIPTITQNPSDPPPIRFANFGEDVGSLVGWLSNGQLNMEQLGIGEPKLHEALVDAWWESKNGDADPLKLGESVVALLETAYCSKSGWTEKDICRVVGRRKARMRADILSVSARFAAMAAELEPLIGAVTAHYLSLDVLEASRTETYEAVVERWQQAKASGEDQASLEAAVTGILQDGYCRQPVRAEAERICFGMMVARRDRAEAARRAEKQNGKTPPSR